MTPRRPLALAAAAVVCAGVVIAPLPTAATLLFALLLVLVLPGYALLEALDTPELETIQRLALVPALSIATVIVVTLLLDLTPFGLTAGSWGIGIAAVVVLASAVALVRGTGVTDDRPPIAVRIRPANVLVAFLAIGVLAGAVVLVRTPLSAKNAQGYTRLSLVRGPGQSVTVEVESGELQTTTYRVDVWTNTRMLYRNSAVRLEPGKHMLKVIKLRGPAGPVRAALYLSNSTQVYRRANLR